MGLNGKGFISKGWTISYIRYRIKNFIPYSRARQVDAITWDQFIVAAEVYGRNRIFVAIATAATWSRAAGRSGSDGDAGGGSGVRRAVDRVRGLRGELPLFRGYPRPPSARTGVFFKDPAPDVSARMLIDQAGLKGLRVGRAELSDRHSNYIIAQPGSKAADVLALIDAIRQRVSGQFGYDLELQLQVW